MKRIGAMMSRGKVTVLAVVVALVLVGTPAAFAANGNPWLLGRNNVATAVTSLGGTLGVDGPMLRITNNNAGSNDTALSLNVQAGEAPLRVNRDTKVANLNADLLDNRDSSAFGVKLIKSGMEDTRFCDAVNTWNECADVQVTVPAGKTYEALITAEATFYEFADGENRVLFCPSARLSTKTTTPLADCAGEERALLLKNDEMESASDTTVRTLTEGTWVISGAVNPSSALDFRSGLDYAKAQTIVLIRDASAPAPQTQ